MMGMTSLLTKGSLVLLFAVSSCYAGNGFSAPCSESWVRYDKRLDPHVYSDLSECQAKYLGNIETNDILLGGKGDGSIGTIPIDDDTKGCKDSTECMNQCQALCCLVPNCNYALIKREQNSNCEISCSIYGSSETLWFCRLYYSGTQGKSDDHSYCDPQGTKPQTCEKLGATGFGWTKSEYESLKSLYNVDPASCPSARRKLLAKSKPIIPKASTIKAKLNKFKKSMEPIRDGFRKAAKNAGGKANFTKKMCDNLKCKA